jgi:hypothetical protein
VLLFGGVEQSRKDLCGVVRLCPEIGHLALVVVSYINSWHPDACARGSNEGRAQYESTRLT